MGTVKPKRVLVVENEPIVALATEQTLKDAGYSSTSVHSGQDAVEAVRDDPDIALVVMDVDLGSGIDGATSAEGILNVRTVPVVFLSAHSEKAFVDRAKTVSNYGYVLKGSGNFVLLQTIENAIRLFETEQALRETAAKYQLLADNAADTVLWVDRNLNPLYLSPSVQRHSGYSVQDYQETNVLHTVHPDDRNRVQNELQELIRQGAERGESQYRIITKQGDTPWMEAKAKLLYDHAGQFDGFVLAENDITKRKKLEEELRESEEKYRLLAENTADVIFTLDRDLNLTYVSPSAENLIGAPAPHFEELNWFDPIEPRDVEQIANDIRRTRKARDEYSRSEFRLRTADAKAKWVETVARYFYHETGDLKRIIGITRDITQRKRTEEALRRNEEQFRFIAENSSDVIMLFDSNWDLLYASPSVERMGYRPHEVTTDLLQEIVHPEDRERVRNEMQDSHKADKTTTTIEHRVITKSGETRWVETRNSYQMDEFGQVDRIIFDSRDITERKRFEQSLEEAIREKQHLMDELNHRVKNNIAMVSSLISLRDQRLGAAADLSDLRNQVDTIKAVHEHLQHSDTVAHIDVSSYVETLLSSVFAQWSGQPVDIHYDIEARAVPTKAATTIGVIVNELATNAMKHGFTEETKPRFKVGFHTDTEAQEYVLTVSNTGNPFPQDIDIENPKTLGLELISASVKQRRGTIHLRRTPSPVFTIRIPADKS